MDKSASRAQAVQKQRAPVPAHLPAAPPPAPLSYYLHLGTTLVLALVAAILLGLLAAGKLRFGSAGVAPSEDKKQDKDEEKGGRYQIEAKEELAAVIAQAGKLDYFGDRIAEAQAFKYKGGFLEVWLEPETYGKSSRGDLVPAEWPKLLAASEGIKANDPEAFVKEGTVLVSAVRPVMPVNEALEPYHQHLGGLFVVGPAGGLHQMTTAHLPASHWQIYRILLQAGPPKGGQGTSFNLWTAQVVNIRQPLVAEDVAFTSPVLGGGTELAPDAEVTLLARKRGSTTIKVKARFLSEDSVRKAAGK